MSKAKRKRKEKEAARNIAEAQTEATLWQGKRLVILIVGVFIVLLAIIIVINHHFSEDQKYYRINVVNVNDESIGMDYFIRRCDADGSDPMYMLTTLATEIIIRKEAESIGLEISDEMVDEKLIETAQGDSESITQSEFKEWYKQTLNDKDLSDAEYREMIATDIMGEYFYEAICAMAPTTAEQVHLHVIMTDTEEKAEEVKARYEAGESFADLAEEFSIDYETSETAGDAGWIPREVYKESRFDSTAFELEPGVLSDILPYYNTYTTSSSTTEYYITYYIIMVSEKASDREIDEKYMDTVEQNTYEDWLGEKYDEYDISFKGIDENFDSETYTWIEWQLQKRVSDDDED